MRELTDLITTRRPGHVLRVALDGPDAAGKTTMADALAARLAGQRPTIRVSIDGFHRPRLERYRHGPLSPEGYFEDSFDYPAVRRWVLEPLGPGGDRRYRPEVFDHRTDLPVDTPPRSPGCRVRRRPYVTGMEVDDMFTEAFPILSTRDLPRLLGFYRDVLGFTETYRFPDDGPAQYVGLELGTEGQLGLGEEASTPTTAEQRLDLCIYAEDCDAAVAHLRAHGATITSEPADMPWGERAAHAEDPDGNRLLILSRL